MQCLKTVAEVVHNVVIAVLCIVMRVMIGGARIVVGTRAMKIIRRTIMQIKLVEEDVTYYEKASKKKYLVNGKEVVVQYWIKQDNELCDYDGDYKIIKGEESLTEDELDALNEEISA